MVRTVDGRLSPEQILPATIGQPELSVLLQAARGQYVGSAVQTVTFPTAFGQVPTVVATPAGSGAATTVKIGTVTTTSFQVTSDVAGSANWFAHGVK